MGVSAGAEEKGAAHTGCLALPHRVVILQGPLKLSGLIPVLNRPHILRPQVLAPKRTTMQARVVSADRGMLHFIRHLLVPDPAKRPTAAQALKHPWLQYRYRSPK